MFRSIWQQIHVFPFFVFLTGNYAEVYQCQFKLAQYFQSTNDKWLADHFFDSCLSTASGISNDEGKMAAEGHCNVGLALEESGNYEEAARNYENFYKLTEAHEDWTYEDDKNMHCESCKLLARIYTTIAHGYQESDTPAYLDYLTKATEMSLKGERNFSVAS